MKKSIYLLAALSLLGTNVFATEDAQVIKKESIKEEYVNENLQLETTSFVEEDKWTFIGRTYLETEDFEHGDDDDGTFWGTGVTASKGKLSLDLNVERRFGGDLSGTNADAEWEADRVDYKVRYQLFTNQAFHIKYRNEDKVAFSDRAPEWMQSSKRDRFELGTDFNHFNGLFAGWFVIGHDEDKLADGTSTDGNYWEGDFGPTFKINDRLSINPTIYTTGEFYDGSEMVETQLRIMVPYKVNEKLTIMPRIRLTLDKNADSRNEQGKMVDNYDQDFGDRVRYELLANINISEDLSSFVGIAYEHCERNLADGGTGEFDLIWSYVGLTYKFN